MSSYIYERTIGPGYIRLLRLFKGSQGPIQCDLFESKLALLEDPDAQDYAAVSYTWGNGLRTCEILVNGKKTEVTTNVYLALRDLQLADEDRILWIDALSIDQSNDEEKSKQVQQMGSVYRNAERVMIWLGQATYETDCLMICLQQLERGSKEYISDDQETPNSLMDLWEAMMKNSNDAHFNILSVIQETANAQAAEIVCGSRSVAANTFAQALSLLNIDPDPHCRSLLDVMPGPLRYSSWWAEKRNLQTILCKFRGSDATDARDKIYALLSVSSDACDTVLLNANYEKTLADVIFDTTLFLLGFNNSDYSVDQGLGSDNLELIVNQVFRLAVHTGQRSIVKHLILRNDVDVTLEVNYRPNAALWWAAGNGYEDVVELLLATGKFAIDIRLDDGDPASETPLNSAARGGHEAIIKLLLESKANTDSNHDFHQKLLYPTARHGYDVLMKQLLATSDANVDLANENGDTPLLEAAIYGNDGIVKQLLATGKAKVDLGDTNGETPLLRAASYRHEGVVKLLLDAEAKVDLADYWGISPLYSAADHGHTEVVKQLLEAEAKIDLSDHRGRSPLYSAADQGRDGIVKLLLEAEAKIDLADDRGTSPLYSAANQGHDGIVKLLLAFKADVNLANNFGETPLWSAISRGREEVVKLLLEANANIDLAYKNGTTPLSLALQEGHVKIAKMLQSATHSRS